MSELWLNGLLVALGGATGASLRFLIDGWVRQLVADRFPLGTVVVNVVGSAALGLVLRVVDAGAPAWIMPLVGTGVCGALTTFSTFSYDTVLLLERRAWVGALSYALGSLLLGVFAFWVGAVLGA